ncbi:MAG: response regulator [Spirochaetales bacterium]|nr:response regulator [Spirochaetales bacterium]
MKTILVIDDIEYVRKTIGKILRSHGFTVYSAANVSEATDTIKKVRIDLLITDIVMPKKSGIELLIDLRKELENTKIIVITGKVSPEAEDFRNLVIDYGVSAILYKPFKKKELLETVEKTLASH